MCMGQIFGGKPDMPAAPAAPAMPEAMTKADQANEKVQKASAKEMAQRKLAKGTNSTILTGALGLQEDKAQVSKKTLLGA